MTENLQIVFVVDDETSVRRTFERPLLAKELRVEAFGQFDAIRQTIVAGAVAQECTEELRTLREGEVMEYVVTDTLNKQVAYDLGMSETTKNGHRERGMEKMHVSSVTELDRHVSRLVGAERSSSHGATHH